MIDIIEALVVSQGEKNAANLVALLREAGCDRICVLSSCGEARRTIIEKEFDICIINAPLKDESGERLACSIASKNSAEVILIAPAEVFGAVSEKVEDYGVITVVKPIDRAVLWSSIKIALATHKRMMNYRNENQKLIQKIEDIKLVDRAKCCLIEYLVMSEEQAHKYIEKQAMDMRKPKREIAQEILKTYERE